MKSKVEWTKEAKSSLDYHCEIIALESLKNARNVRRVILSTAKVLEDYPRMYQQDEYYFDSNKDIRRFFCWSYTIVYQVKEPIIRILDVIHTKSNPINFE